MSKVYRYSEDEAEKSKDMMALLIEGIRAASYGRSKPTSLGFSSLESRRFNRETGWDFIMEPGIAAARRPSRKPVRHEHGLRELGFISEGTVDSGDVGIVTGFDPGVKSSAINCGGKIWQIEDVYTPPEDSVDDIAIAFKEKVVDDLESRLRSGKLEKEVAHESMFSTIVMPYLDPNDPDPLGTARAMQKVVLPDLKAMYAPDLDWYNAVQKQIIEAMGIPASMLSAGPKLGGMGRYYSEAMDSVCPGYYSFEET